MRSMRTRLESAWVANELLRAALIIGFSLRRMLFALPALELDE